MCSIPVRPADGAENSKLQTAPDALRTGGERLRLVEHTATWIVSVGVTDDHFNRDYFSVAGCLEACKNDAEHRGSAR